MSIQEQSLPKQKTSWSFITTGLALFSMFFGAGNLIFPLMIGKSVEGHLWPAIMGLGLTAVVVPFLGLAGMVLFQGDYRRFFGRIGKIPGMMLLLLLQLILGPFGVIPRLVTLMHATAGPYLSGTSIMWFSILAAVLIFACSFKRERLISFLGGLLTPILLVSLAALIILGLIDGSTINAAHATPGESFLQGLLGGYKTMDLIAAFLFATVILPHFQKETNLEHPSTRRRSLLKKMTYSSLIAAGLLFLTYVGLCFVSAHHGRTLDPSLPPEQMLSAIAIKLLGPAGGCIAAIAVITTCLTTAMSLSAIFADYLRKDLCKEKISPTWALILTLAATTFFANLGFGGIAAFLNPILTMVYPGLIMLTILNLFHSLYGTKMVKMPVFLTFATAAFIYLM